VRKFQRRLENEIIALFKSPTPQSRIFSLRGKVYASDYPKLVAFLRKNPSLAHGIENKYTSHLELLFSGPYFKNIDLDRQIKWSFAYLQSDLHTLKRFAKLSQKYSNSLLSGDLNVAKDCLDVVEREFGVSLWLCKQQLNLSFLVSGETGVKAFLQAATSKIGDNRGLVLFLLLQMGRQMDRSIDADRFLEIEQEIVQTSELDKDLQTYLRYRINPLDNFSEEEISCVLNFEGRSVAVDHYEALIWAIPRLKVGSGSKMSELVRKLAPQLEDNRLDLSIYKVSRNLESSTHATQLKEAFDAFLSNDFKLVRQRTNTLLKTSAEDIEARELLVKATLLSESGPPFSESSGLGSELNKLLGTTIAKEGSIHEAIDEILRLAISYAAFPWARGLLAVIDKEFSPTADIITDSNSEGTMINSFPCSPLRVNSFEKAIDKSNFAAHYLSIFKESPSTAYVQRIASNDFSPFTADDHGEWLFIRAVLAFQNAEYETALLLSLKLSKDESPYYARRGYLLQPCCYSALEMHWDCVNSAVEAFLKYPMVVPSVLNKAIVSVQLLTDDQVAQSLAVPILYALAAQHKDNSFEADVADSYEMYLDSMGITKASDLGPYIPSADNEKYIYFLREVASIPVMERSGSFKDAEEIRQERLKICQQLLELDPLHTDSTAEEISEITQASMIKRRLHEVEQGKVYVDIDGIRRSISQEVKAAFRVYISYLRNSTSSDYKSALDKSREFLQSGSWDDLRILSLPRDDASDKLRSVLLNLRDQFVSNTEYGLDGYLSTNIRHGTLLNHLRAPVSAAKLITELDGMTGEYKSNYHLLYQIDSPTVRETIDARLKEFSRNFDQAVNKIKDEIMQVDKTGEGSGLFKFVILESNFTALAFPITEDSSFEEFFDSVFEHFDLMLSANLVGIIKYLRSNIKPMFMDLLNKLEEDLDKFGTGIGPIKAAIILARTGITESIESMEEWFTPSGSFSQEPLVLEDAVLIAAESIKHRALPFTLTLDKKTDFGLPFIVKRIHHVVNIFYALFLNIIKDARGDYVPEAIVTTSYSEKTWHVTVKNRLHPTVDKAELRRRLDVLREGIRREDFGRAIRSEGGTGLIKIRKIISTDLQNPDATYTFDIEEDMFVVRLDLGFQIVELGGTN